MKVKSLLGNKILVDKFPDEEKKNESGIITDLAIDKYITKPKKGKVFMIGGSVNFELTKKGEKPINVGDEILYDRNEFAIVSSKNKDYELILSSNLICIIDEND